jgi:peptidyl-prolyl cis-trans isomerase C
MKKLMNIMILTALSAIMAYGCAQGEKSDSPVIANVNKGAITEADFIKELSRVPEWARPQFKETEGKSKFLDELVKKELIYQNAKKMRLDNNEEYLAKVKEFEKLTLVSLALKKEVDDKVKIDETEVKAFFEENKDKFTVGTQIRASHILVKTEEEAKSIHAKIESGEDFAALAKAFSADKGSAEKGGDVGYFGRGRMVPEFERAALGLKPGEVSGPVKTRFGYHIIKLTDIKKGDPASFEQSKEAISRELINQKRKKYFDALVDKLKEGSEISTNENVLEAMALPWEKEEMQAPAPEQQTEKPSTPAYGQPETK